MDCLLTDEEMAKTTGHTIGYLHFDKVLIGKFRIIAKAEAEKLVIAFSENSHMGKKYLNVNPQWWQALRKDLGL